MSRQNAILTILAAVLVVVLFFFFLFQPRANDIAEARTQAEDVRAQQQVTRTRITQLEAVRAEAPEVEAALAAAETIIPRNSALPAAVRQIQMAANTSGGTLVSIAVTRPQEVETTTGAAPATGAEQLAQMGLTVSFSGGYFQVVDFLRRIEDPAITPRAVVWESLSVADEEYPVLTTSLSGRMFALLPPGSVDEAPSPEPTDGATETSTEAAAAEVEG